MSKFEFTRPKFYFQGKTSQAIISPTNLVAFFFGNISALLDGVSYVVPINLSPVVVH